MASKTESSLPHRNKPDHSQMQHWERLPETQWVMGKLKEQFRPLQPHQAAASWDEYKTLTGQQQVIHAIEKLCGH